MTITSHHDTPVVFRAGAEELFGIFTEPDGNANGIAVLNLWGAGGAPTFGKNQVRTRLARELAERGFHVLRFNYRGVAESGGSVREVDFDNPWTEDALGAVRWLESQEFTKIILIGKCFGGRIALAAADQVPGLIGLALVTSPIGDAGHREAILGHPISWYLKQAAAPRSLRLMFGGGMAKRRRKTAVAKLRRLLTGARKPPPDRASSAFLQPLRAVLGAGIPVLMFFGRRDDFYHDFDRARAGALGRMIQRWGDLVTVHEVDARLGGMDSLETQDLLLSTLISWTEALAQRDGAARTARERVGLRTD